MESPAPDRDRAVSNDFADLDATAQAELVRSGQTTADELTEAAIARIERINPELNAVITRLYDEARTLVRRRGARNENGKGPFGGVPFLLKDIVARHARARYTAGSRALAEFVDEKDSELTTRLRNAGLVILGKTNTPEFGLLPTTEPLLFGPTRNPWDPTRSTGGSSGGSAAAVAARLVPMAHANDGGGSIRIPASCCGLFGLKPTRGRNPLGPDTIDMLGLVAEHAVTVSVRDSAALLDATCGPDAGAPYWAAPPARPFRDEVGADPGRLRIAVSTKAPAGTPVHPDCITAAEDAAKLCASLGHEVIESAPRIDGTTLYDAFVQLWGASCAWQVETMAKRVGADRARAGVEPFTWALHEHGKHASAIDFMNANAFLQRTAREIGRFFQGVDLWLTPTLGHPPPPLGHFDVTGEDAEAVLRRSAAFVPFTPIANMTGQPAMSVPLSWNAEGLPIGVHFQGRYGEEATLFRLAAQLEAARPWADRKPPVSA